jgi:hypothetical protein
VNSTLKLLESHFTENYKIFTSLFLVGKQTSLVFNKMQRKTEYTCKAEYITTNN